MISPRIEFNRRLAARLCLSIPLARNGSNRSAGSQFGPLQVAIFHNAPSALPEVVDNIAVQLPENVGRSQGHATRLSRLLGSTGSGCGGSCEPSLTIWTRASVLGRCWKNPRLKALGLPRSYPLDTQGEAIPHSRCQHVGVAVRGRRLLGIWCRSVSASLHNRLSLLAI